MTVSQPKQSPFRAFPVLIALFFNVVIGPALPIVATAATNVPDYSQCQIGNPKPVTLDCDSWINGILNATHNDYAEGEVVPQRLIVDFDTLGAHSVQISYMARKDSGGQHHAYDYLATWNYTYVNADKCQDLNPDSLCIPDSDPTPSFLNIPSDGNSVSPGGPQPTSAHELPQSDRQFVMYGGDLTSTSAITHTTDPAEAGSDYGVITVNFNVTDADGRVMLLFGGHLAVGTGPLGWGAGLGASSISGGPYHIRITAIDGASIGNRDNQIMSGAIEPLFPLLVVEKVADAATVSAGSNIGFTITVTNNGPGVANNATLNDPLPAGSGVDWAINPAYAGPGTCSITGSPPTETLTCAFGNLADDASASVHVQSATTAASCGEYPNTATANADNFDPVQASASTTVQCPNLSITKTPDGGTVNAGDPISFTITVSNAGPGAATNVDIDDNLPAGFEWVESPDKAECTIVSNVLHCDIASLASGASFSVTVTSPTQAADCGLVTNTATGDADNHAQITNSGNQTVECPDLTAEKLADDDLVSAGQEIGFTISIENADESNTGTAFNMTIVDLLPDGDGIDWEIAADSLDDGACSIDGSPPAETLECDFGDLGPGDAVSVHVVSDTTLASCETYRNVATVDADNHARLLPEDSLTVECPNYNVAKVARVGTIDAGETAIFDIVVWNAGEGTAFDVTLTDTLPGDLTWSEDSEDCSISEGVLTCDFGDLAAGSSQEEPGASVTLSALTDRTDCGELDNRAIVDANPGEPVQSSDSITVKCPLVSIVKVNNTTASVLPGTNVTFTLTVTVSDGPAEDVTVVDTLPTGYNAPTLISDGGTFNATTRKITWELGDLADGPHSVTYQAAVSAGVANGTQLVNVAIVFSSNSQCPSATSLAPACDDDSTVTVRVPTLVIDKAANVELITKTLDPQGNVISIVPPSVTWTLTYTLTNGPVTNAVITDPIPAGLTYVNGSASNGGVYNAGTKTLTWTFPLLSNSGFVTFQTTVNQDAPAGVILNVATIDSEETGPDEGQDSIRIVEDQQLGGTSTPQPSLPSTALNQPSSGGSMAALLFGMILIAALGGLAYVNVVAVRRRR